MENNENVTESAIRIAARLAAEAGEMAAKMEAAYDPEECESCEIGGGTCWECAVNALA